MSEYRNFVGSSYTSQSPIVDAERCLNWYVEKSESAGAKVPLALYPTPGLQVFATANDAPGRGFYETEGRVFAVIGGRLQEINADGSLTERGVVTIGDLPATIHGNGDVGNELLVTSGGNGYVFNMLTNVLSIIPALAGTSDMGEYLDGFFISLERATSTFRISDLADGTVWDPLQAQQRTASTDRWQSVLVSNRDIWLFGSKTTDVWNDTGAAPFPFTPIPGANIEWGIAAADSAAVLGSPIWLSASREGSGIVLQASGYNVRRISTHAVELAISTYTRIDDARAWVYQEIGHSFYCLTFPTARATWCYDAATQLWHERAYWNTRTAEEEAWRPYLHVLAFGRHLALDRLTGAIYHQSVNFGSDVDGAEIRRLRRAPHVQAGSAKPTLVVHAFAVDLQNGLGIPSGQGVNPLMMLRVSKDGARTWGIERHCEAGRQGEYILRTTWEQLGSGRDIVFEVAVSDPIPWRLAGADLDVTRCAY